MALGRWVLLRRLRRAIQKVRFLITFDMNRLPFLSILGSNSMRRLSFRDPPGLLDCTIETEPGGSEIERTPSPVMIQRTSSNVAAIRRTSSDALADDIDKRADIFIANFYKHIQMERQVSLELRYCHSNSIERAHSYE